MRDTLKKEWNYKKNVGMSPDELTDNSGKKVWWVCLEGHEWESRIADRTRGNKCPYCSGKKPILGVNDLKTVNPQLAAEWNYVKNKKVPEAYLPHSGKKVWWLCSKGHEWEATIDSRSRGNNCVYCAGQRVISGENDLKTLNPKLALEWDYEANGDLLPENVMLNYGKPVHWICEKGHKWSVSPNSRVSQHTGCAQCSAELRTSFSEQAILFYVKKVFEAKSRYQIEGHELDIYIPSEKIAIEYDGIYYHSSKEAKDREKRKNVFCTEHGICLYRVKEIRKGQRIKKGEENIFYRFVEREDYLVDAIEWIISKLSGIKKKTVIIDLDSDRQEIMAQYINGNKENSLLVRFPMLENEWDYEKNQNMRPEQFSWGTKKKVWWKCKLGHSYQAAISHRTSAIDNTNCPICAGQKIQSGYNDLATLRPDLLKEWDFDSNIDFNPHNISANYSAKKLAWICEKGHRFEATPHKRNNGRNCPYCSGKKVLKGFNDLASRRPDVIMFWDYNENRDFLPTEVTLGSNKVVKWKCKACGYSWKQQINIQTKRKTAICKRCGNNGQE